MPSDPSAWTRSKVVDDRVTPFGPGLNVCSWHFAAVQPRPHLSPLSEVRRTTFARFELYLV